MNSKDNNQYIGKSFEACCMSILNNDSYDNYYKENVVISQSEIEKQIEGAKKIADIIGSHKAIYVGNHTINETGDIVLDNGNHVEIKYVSQGTGTYHGTSVSYFNRFGFDFNDYMNKYGLYEAFEKAGISFNKKNKSPVSQTDSSYIRHNMEDVYNEFILPANEKVIKGFMTDLMAYFHDNEEDFYKFISDMLNKVKSNVNSSCPKFKPDYYYVYNYKRKTVSSIDVNKYFNANIDSLKITDKGFCVGDIRFQIGWQNGNGLNNPTIRVFLKD